MKVICIDAGRRPDSNNSDIDLPKLKETDIYTVIGEPDSDSYLFLEITHSKQPIAGWIKTRFIPISEIDETELVNQKVEIYDTGIVGRNQSL